jgi:hypothetical protein
MSHAHPQKQEIAQVTEQENANLRHTRSAGAFTISPELFEKVRSPASIHSSMVLTPASYI